MRFLLPCSFAVCAVISTVFAQVTPLTEPLAEEKEMTITCEITKPPPRTGIPVFGSSRSGEAAVGTYHYKLWLPKGYLADSQKKWPCMFIMSPGGNAGMGGMQYLKDKGFVVVMLVEAKNGPWGPIVGNFLAAHDDVVQRVRIAEGQKYATGFSGGARGSSVFVQARPGFCGLVMQGAGAAMDNGKYLVPGIRSNAKLYSVLVMGRSDGNASEIQPMKRALGPARLEVLEFDGGHQGAPSELFAEAMEWIAKKSGAGASPFGR